MQLELDFNAGLQLALPFVEEGTPNETAQDDDCA